MSIQSLNEQTKFSTAFQWPFNAQSICENYLSSNWITSRLPGFGLTCLLSEGPRNLWGLTHKYSFLEQWNPFTLQQRFFCSAISNGCYSISNLTACLRSNNSEDTKKYLNLFLRHAWRATAEFTAWYYGSGPVFSSLQKVEAIANLIKPDWCQKAISTIVGWGDSVVNYICGSRVESSAPRAQEGEIDGPIQRREYSAPMAEYGEPGEPDDSQPVQQSPQGRILTPEEEIYINSLPSTGLTILDHTGSSRTYATSADRYNVVLNPRQLASSLAWVPTFFHQGQGSRHDRIEGRPTPFTARRTVDIPPAGFTNTCTISSATSWRPGPATSVPRSSFFRVIRR